jgi:hypothetical protein
MRAILLASAAIIIASSVLPATAADLAVVPGHHHRVRTAVAYDCPPTPGGVLSGRLDRWRRNAGECVLDDWVDRPGIDVVWNQWNLY